MLGLKINGFYAKAAADVAIWTLLTPLAYLVRYNGAIPATALPSLLITTAGALIIKVLVVYGFRLYRQCWSRTSLNDLITLSQAIALVMLVGFLGISIQAQFMAAPRLVPFLDGIFAMVALGGMRVARRYLYEWQLGTKNSKDSKKRVLIVGAGEAGTMVAKEMRRHPNLGLVPVGYVDDDPAKQRMFIAGVPVLGSISDLPETLDRLMVDEVLIAMPSVDGSVVRRIIQQDSLKNVTYRIVPGVFELLGGKVTVNRFREVSVEDLLRRKPISLDLCRIEEYLTGKTVLVTGAGGSIGSELVRQISRFSPGRLLLFGISENEIYDLERELDRSCPNVPYTSVIGDVRNRARLERVFLMHQPEVVFHAAAHKHVPLMEANPEEAVLNNIMGSKNLAELALEHGVRYFVNISTDKAVNPSSVMGASKCMAEHVVQQVSHKAQPWQHFVSVRFGNVLGSRGSVIPLFKDQIKQGGPVTITHPDMRRYFMTIPEASQLVLQAAGLGNNGEVYILDMGEPIKIADLAHDLIKLSGFEPGEDIPIEYTGLRPGEKLFEELMTEEEKQSSTTHEQIFVAKRPEFSDEALNRTLEELLAAARVADGEAIRVLLQGFIRGCAFQQAAEETAREPRDTTKAQARSAPQQAGHDEHGALQPRVTTGRHRLTCPRNLPRQA